jgi:YNFM family putative membrane transporter
MSASLAAIPLPDTESPTTAPIVEGSPAFRAATRAIAFGGFAAFAMLYGLQPLMPMFAREFGLSPAAASGVVSVSTGMLAAGLIPAGIVAQRFGPKTTIIWALALAAMLNLLAACAQGYDSILWLRAALGLAIAGMPGVAMAYLAEEVEAKSLGRAIGLLIAGNALGGMSGRLIAATLGDWFGWRVALCTLGVVGAAAAVEFWRSLPASRHFRSHRFDGRRLLADARAHLGDGGLPWLFLLAFLLMGCFVSLYNYLGFRLEAAPFHLRTSVVGLIFSLYMVGMFSSSWAGRLADRMSRRKVLWIMVGTALLGLWMTLSSFLPILVAGIAIFTFGFFGAHSVASSWVGRRALQAKTLASSLYLAAYYFGSSILGSISGLIWQAGAWLGVALFLSAILLACFGIALHLRTLEPKVS